MHEGPRACLTLSLPMHMPAVSGKGAVVARPCPRTAFHAISAPRCPGLRKSFSARPTPSQTRGPLPLARVGDGWSGAFSAACLALLPRP